MGLPLKPDTQVHLFLSPTRFGKRKIRIELQFPAEKMAYLKQLTAESGLASVEELLLWALELFVWAAEEKRAGSEICSVDLERNEYKALVMVCFANIKLANQIPQNGIIH